MGYYIAGVGGFGLYLTVLVLDMVQDAARSMEGFKKGARGW